MYWGSNGVAAGYGMYLLIANQFAPDPSFSRRGARQPALSAGPQYLFAFVGHASGREPIPASASSSQRGHRRSRGRGCSPAAPMQGGRTPYSRRFPKTCRLPRSMPIKWPRTPAMKLPSTGKPRWYSCWPGNCTRPSRPAPHPHVFIPARVRARSSGKGHSSFPPVFKRK